MAAAAEGEAAAAPARAAGRAGAAGGRGAVGAALAEAARPVIAAWIERLRADPLVPAAAGRTAVELEDHTAGFLADLAQQFLILDEPAEPGPTRQGLVRDGADVRRLLVRRHGAQRAGFGWDEAALAREFLLLGEELERALVARLTDLTAAAVDDARALLREWIADAARESADALRAARTRPSEAVA
jgi:hypothetical protein